MRKLLLLLLIPLFFGCTKKEPVSEKPNLLVTIAPYAYFVERIVGNTADVTTLVPPGVNLHVYEPTPRQVERALQALIWFRIEEPLETKVVQVFKEQKPETKIVNLQEGLDLLSDHEAVELSPCIGHHHDKDLHTWLSPKFALKQAGVIAKNLIALFPENKALYETNFNQLSQDLRILDQTLSTVLKPYKGEAILVSHPALGYFCHDYDLIQLSVECEGKDPRPKDIEKILQKTRTYKVRCALLQAGFNNRGAMLIGEKLQLPIYQIDPYAENYLKNMQEIAGHIAR